jgi:hypothetical protein
LQTSVSTQNFAEHISAQKQGPAEKFFWSRPIAVAVLWEISSCLTNSLTNYSRMLLKFSKGIYGQRDGIILFKATATCAP